MTNLVAAGFKESTPTAIHEVQADIQPTANGIIIYGDVASITVYDTDGKQAARSALSQFCNLAALDRGIYIVQALMKDGTTVSRKILRQ